MNDRDDVVEVVADGGVVLRRGDDEGVGDGAAIARFHREETELVLLSGVPGVVDVLAPTDAALAVVLDGGFEVEAEGR